MGRDGNVRTKDIVSVSVIVFVRHTTQVRKSSLSLNLAITSMYDGKKIAKSNNELET